jgi:hypothetical protein
MFVCTSQTDQVRDGTPRVPRKRLQNADAIHEPSKSGHGRGRPSFEVIHIEVIYRPGVWKAAQEHRVAWHRSAAGSRLYKKAGDK